MKTLHTRKIFALVAYNNIRRTAPREFPNIEEMKLTVEEILPEFVENLEEFIKFRKESDAVNDQFSAGELEEEVARAKIRDVALEAGKWEQKHGREMIDIEFENDAFNTFFQQFERWGKNWMNTVEDFMEFRQHINEANKQGGKSKVDSDK